MKLKPNSVEIRKKAFYYRYWSLWKGKGGLGDRGGHYKVYVISVHSCNREEVLGSFSSGVPCQNKNKNILCRTAVNLKNSTVTSVLEFFYVFFDRGAVEIYTYFVNGFLSWNSFGKCCWFFFFLMNFLFCQKGEKVII